MTNIAIVGAGAIGTRHAKWAAKYGKLIAICDIKKRKANKLAKEYKCKSYGDIMTMLWDDDINIDLVAICVPNYLHKFLTVIALDYCHVLCEKPMALTVEDCEDMINVAEKSNKRLFVVKQNRFNEPVKEVKKVIDYGGLGKIFSVHLNCIWNRNKDYYKNSDWKGVEYKDGGILYTQFSHFIDLLYYLLGDVNKVYAFSKNFTDKAEFPDTIVATFSLCNEAIGTAHFTINSCKKNMEGSMTIIGDKGTVKIGGQYLNTIEYQSILGHVIPPMKQKGNCNEYGTYRGSSSKHDEVYRNVIATLEGRESIMTTALDGLKTIQIIKKIEEACK